MSCYIKVSANPFHSTAMIKKNVSMTLIYSIGFDGVSVEGVPCNFYYVTIY